MLKQKTQSWHEYLYFCLFASILLSVAVIFYALQAALLPYYGNKYHGCFCGFLININDYPAIGYQPIIHPQGNFVMVNTPNGVAALEYREPHSDSKYLWDQSTNQFYNPIDGSRWTIDGTKVKGPATRNIRLLELRVVDANEKLLKIHHPYGDERLLSLPNDARQILVMTDIIY